MDLKSSFEQINVVDIDVHPFYSKFSYLEYDVAVLHLERESEASAITLDSGINLEVGEDMKAIVSCSLRFCDNKYGVHLMFCQGIRRSR